MSHFHPSLCPHSTFLLLGNLISLISQELTLLASSPPPPSSFPCPFTFLYHVFNTTLAPWGFDSITFSWQPTPRSPVPYSTKDPTSPGRLGPPPVTQCSCQYCCWHCHDRPYHPLTLWSQDLVEKLSTSFGQRVVGLVFLPTTTETPWGVGHKSSKRALSFLGNKMTKLSNLPERIELR